MAGQLCYRERRFADSASKTHTQPANPRRTPLCHPDHYLKRKERRQAVGLIRSPFKRMGVGLGAAYGTRCHSSLPKTGSPATEATGSPYDPLRGMRVTRRLLRGQGGFADSASKTDIFPKKTNNRRLLCGLNTPRMVCGKSQKKKFWPERNRSRPDVRWTDLSCTLGRYPERVMLSPQFPTILEVAPMSTVTTVTVVPADKLIICDGVALVFDFQAPDGLHALQWRDDAGHTEWTGGPNQPLTVADYDEQVAPYVALWRKEKTRREEKAAEEAAARALPDAKEAKTAEVLSGYDAALAASLTMPAAMPTSQDVAVGAALFAVDDAEGLAFVQARHAARRDELLAAVDAADSVEAVQAVDVSYDV